MLLRHLAEVKDGFELYDPSDHPAIRQRIEDSTLRELDQVFPQSYNGVRMEVNDLRVAGKATHSIAEQKKALMTNKLLARPVKATLRLFDENTDKLLDEKPDVTLMRIPYYSDRGRFTYNGNGYTGLTQVRMIPGAYTRRQANGGLETQFNVRPGTGRVFRVALDPENGQFRLKIAGSNLHLYSLLRDLGVSDDQLSESWGEGVLDMNRNKYDRATLGKARGKMVPAYARDDADDDSTQIQQVRDALLKAQVARTATNKTLASYWKEDLLDSIEKKATLRRILDKRAAATAAVKKKPSFDVRERGDVDDEGDEYHSVGLSGLLAASKKLLAVNRGLDKVDNRNSPAFMKAYTLDKLLAERIRLDEGRLRRKVMRVAASRRNLDGFPVRAFDGYHLGFITKNPLTTALEDINPLHELEQHRRMTQMGPGGIGSTDAVTIEMQGIQAAEFGFVSPLEGPESSSAGVDTRLASGAQFGKDGRLRQRMINRKTGKEDWVSPEDLHGKTLKLPD